MILSIFSLQLLNICMSLFKKYLFRFFAHILMKLFVYFTFELSFLESLDINTLLDGYVSKYFLPFCMLFFCSFDHFFALKKYFSLIRFHFSILFLLAMILVFLSKILLAHSNILKHFLYVLF